MIPRRTLMGAAAALAVLWAGSAGLAQDPTIQLGALYNTSGPQAVFGGPSLHGARLAAETINASGGVLGRSLELIEVDGDSDADAWTSMVPAALREHPGIVALFGLSDSNNALEAGRASAAASHTFVTSGATSPHLPEQVPTHLFLAAFGDNVQAAAAAEYAYGRLDARNALILFDPDHIYTRLLEGYFATAFRGLGGTVAASEAIAPRSANPSVPEIGGVDLVYLSVESANDAAVMVPIIRATGFTGPIFGGDGYDAASVWSAHPDVADVYFTTHVYLGADTQDPTVAAFIAAYEAAVPGETPTAFSALAYDTVGLLATAIDNAGSAEPSSVADGLLAVDGYRGVTGTISYVDGTRIPRKSVTILQIGNGVQSFVEQMTPSHVPAP